MHSCRSLVARIFVIALLVASAARPTFAKSEGVDLEIGGPGKDAGQFAELRDIVFANGHLYVLEGIRFDKKQNAAVGNLRVQQLDLNGKSIGTFSIIDESLKDKQAPARLAVDEKGYVFIADPLAGVVQRFDPAGKPLASVKIANAAAVALQKFGGQSRIIVAVNPPRPRVKGAELPPVELVIIDPATGNLAGAIKLDRPITNCTQLITDQAGNLYLKAGESQAFKFDPHGKWMVTFGAGTKRHLPDASELTQTIAVDSKQNLYGFTPGNPGSVCRFDPQGQTVSMRRGQYGFADSWGYNRPLTLVIDDTDRLWIADNGQRVTAVKAHALPCVLRTLPNFWEDGRAVVTKSTAGLGLVVTAVTSLPDNIGYALAPVPVDLIVAAGTLNTHEATGSYVVHDSYKNEIATGTYDVHLQDGVESRKSITFLPPKWGWYVVEFTLKKGDDILASGGCNIGLTPKFADMPVLNPGESTSNWADPARQMFAGQNLMRLHPAGNLVAFEKDLTNAEKFHAKVFAQFSSLKECDPAFVKEVVTKYKDRVKYWEIMNEPNFSMTADKYVELVKTLRPIIKGISPDAIILGPDHCGTSLEFYQKFYELGGGPMVDVLSIHDYEGHETIDVFFWRWKLAELRKIMAAHGDANKEIWQTERCISSLRANTFLGTSQAVRVTLHYDLLESLGIPVEHNLYYYLNEGGYKSVPAYTWSHLGPYPASLATRTRAAMVGQRAFSGPIDWGMTGNNMMLGLNYAGADGATVLFRNFGTQNLPVTFDVSGDQVELVDAFGNSQTLPIKGGQITLPTSAMPQYLMLQKGQTATAKKIDYGRNLAPQLTFNSASDFKGDYYSLANDEFESPHGGDPRRYLYWRTSLANGPQSLEMKLPSPRSLNRMVIWSLHADNGMCALLDFDLEYFDGSQWKPLKQVRTNVPKSNLAPMSDFRVLTWDVDQSFHDVEFPAVITDRLRITALRTTYGLLPDIEAVKLLGSKLTPTFMIRELQLFGPANEVVITSRVQSKSIAAGDLIATITNNGKSPVGGTVKLTAPSGWKLQQDTIAVSDVPPGKSAEIRTEIIGPEQVDAGLVPIDLSFADAGGKVIESDRVSLFVAAPVSFNFKKTMNQAGQPTQAIEVTNITDQTVSCPVEVSVVPVADASAKPVSAQITFDALEVGRTKGTELPLPGADLTTGAWRATIKSTIGRVTVTEHQTVGPN